MGEERESAGLLPFGFAQGRSSKSNGLGLKPPLLWGGFFVGLKPHANPEEPKQVTTLFDGGVKLRYAEPCSAFASYVCEALPPWTPRSRVDAVTFSSVLSATSH